MRNNVESNREDDGTTREIQQQKCRNLTPTANDRFQN